MIIPLATACSGSSGGDGASSPADLLAAGIQLQQSGDTNGAKQLFERVLQKEPNNVYAHYNLGVIAQGANDTTTALAEYDKALAGKPDYVPALFNEATIYGGTDPQKAISLYREVIRLQPVSPTAFLNLGLLEVNNKQHDQGIFDLDIALHQDPSLGNRIPKKILVEVGRYANAHPKVGSSGSPAPSASAVG